jgi:hypothetical protein
MINYTINQGTDGTQFVHAIGTVPGRDPIGIKVSGTVAQVRARLQKEFTGHLHLLVADIRSLAIEGRFRHTDNLLMKLLKCERFGCTTDYLTYARELEHIQYDLHILLMATTNEMRLHLLIDDLQRTVTRMTESSYGLWVFGEIELLDGTRLKRWIKDKAA